MGVTPCLGHQALVGSPHCGHHHAENAASIFIKCFKSCLTWEWLICLQWRNIISFCTIHIFLHRYQWFSLTLFYNCPPTPLPLVMITVRPCGDGWMFSAPMISGAAWFATKNWSFWRDGCDYCGSAFPKYCVDFVPFINWLLFISGTECFKNLYQEAVRVDCHAGTEQDYGIFGLIWKFEKTSEIILEYAQQTAW